MIQSVKATPSRATGNGVSPGDEHLVARAFLETSKKKSPGPGGIGPLAIACVYEWDPDRIVALLRAHIRLDYHPARWKVVRRVTWTRRLQFGEVVPVHFTPQLPRKDGREGSGVLSFCPLRVGEGYLSWTVV